MRSFVAGREYKGREARWNSVWREGPQLALMQTIYQNDFYNLISMSVFESSGIEESRNDCQHSSSQESISTFRSRETPEIWLTRAALTSRRNVIQQWKWAICGRISSSTDFRLEIVVHHSRLLSSSWSFQDIVIKDKFLNFLLQFLIRLKEIDSKVAAKGAGFHLQNGKISLVFQSHCWRIKAVQTLSKKQARTQYTPGHMFSNHSTYNLVHALCTIQQYFFQQFPY